MKNRIVILILAVAFGACAKTSKNKDLSESVVSDAIENQITEVNNATADVTAGGAVSTLSMITPTEEKFLREQSVWEKIGDLAERLFDSSLHAVACSTSGDVTDTGAAFGTANFTITRTWTNCIRDAGAFKRNGLVYLQWANLLTSPANSTYVQNGTTLKRATSAFTLTRTATGNYVEVTGNDTANAVSGSNANQVLTWTAVGATTRSFTLAMNVTRNGKTPAGFTRFSHIVTTPTILTINVDTSAQTRTLVSGTLNVRHDIAGVDVATTFNNATWSTTTCLPVSGSATVSVTGNKTGSGTLTFSSGSVSYTYGSETGSITLPGC